MRRECSAIGPRDCFSRESTPRHACDDPNGAATGHDGDLLPCSGLASGQVCDLRASAGSIGRCGPVRRGPGLVRGTRCDAPIGRHLDGDRRAHGQSEPAYGRLASAGFLGPRFRRGRHEPSRDPGCLAAVAHGTDHHGRRHAASRALVRRPIARASRCRAGRLRPVRSPCPLRSKYGACFNSCSSSPDREGVNWSSIFLRRQHELGRLRTKICRALAATLISPRPSSGHIRSSSAPAP